MGIMGWNRLHCAWTFVDDMIHTSTSQPMLDEFSKLCAESFKYTGVDLIHTFLGMEVEQKHGKIYLHLNTYIQKVLDDFKAIITKELKPKQVPMHPGVILTNENCPETPYPREQKLYRSFLAKG